MNEKISKLNKPVEKVKKGEFSSLKSKKVIYGAAADSMLKKIDFKNSESINQNKKKDEITPEELILNYRDEIEKNKDEKILNAVYKKINEKDKTFQKISVEQQKELSDHLIKKEAEKIGAVQSPPTPAEQKRLEKISNYLKTGIDNLHLQKTVPQNTSVLTMGEQTKTYQELDIESEEMIDYYNALDPEKQKEVQNEAEETLQSQGLLKNHPEYNNFFNKEMELIIFNMMAPEKVEKIKNEAENFINKLEEKRGEKFTENEREELIKNIIENKLRSIKTRQKKWKAFSNTSKNIGNTIKKYGISGAKFVAITTPRVIVKGIVVAGALIAWQGVKWGAIGAYKGLGWTLNYVFGPFNKKSKK